MEWNGNFPENYFGHFGLSCKVVLNFRENRKIPSHWFISGRCLHFGTTLFDVIGFERPTGKFCFIRHMELSKFLKKKS